jgi:hypothetical protein
MKECSKGVEAILCKRTCKEIMYTGCTALVLNCILPLQNTILYTTYVPYTFTKVCSKGVESKIYKRTCKEIMYTGCTALVLNCILPLRPDHLYACVWTHLHNQVDPPPSHFPAMHTGENLAYFAVKHITFGG